MTYALFDSNDNKISEVTITRQSANTIKVRTENRLSDDQLKDLYYIIYAMEKTGTRLKDMFKMEPLEKRGKNNGGN